MTLLRGHEATKALVIRTCDSGRFEVAELIIVALRSVGGGDAALMVLVRAGTILSLYLLLRRRC